MRPVTPGPGQESIWAYPKPPVVDLVARRLEVEHGSQLVADAPGGFRVLETGQPPAYYIPRDRVRMDLLRPVKHTTQCPFKGTASYFDLVVPDREPVPQAAWTYEEPKEGYEDIAGCIAFYAQDLDACRVDRETVRAPPGTAGGWITKSVVGPFPGEGENPNQRRV